MRITKSKLTEEERNEIFQMVDEMNQVKDMTLATDFAEDAYALFKEKISKRRLLKSFWEIFKDVRSLYTLTKLGDLMKNVDFYNKIRGFFRYFIISKLFFELNKLDPMEALRVFLNMFQPPKQAQPQQQPSQTSQNDEEQSEDSEDDSTDGNQENEPQNQKQPRQSSKSEDQQGTSADEGNLPIDMTEFRKNVDQIEKTIESGLFDSEDLQDYLNKHAGIGHKDLKIGNIMDIIKKIANKLSSREMDIFYVARIKEVTEQYRRDEVLESVPFPDNEMSVKNIDNPMEILKLVPTQYAYDDDIFMQKLLRKELLVRDYQSRRLKRQSLYLLIDVSGSMQGKKNIYASGVALALVRQAISEGSTYFLRFFDDSPGQVIKVKTKEDAQKLCDTLVRNPYSGGGTSIQSAILAAIDDIHKAPEDFEKSEIMVITDGEDRVSINKEALKNIKVHSTIIDGSNTELKLISDTYQELQSVDI
jgi:uncharacterized protein with von Willebrand factor type A (vWA) domain